MDRNHARVGLAPAVKGALGAGVLGARVADPARAALVPSGAGVCCETRAAVDPRLKWKVKDAAA